MAHGGHEAQKEGEQATARRRPRFAPVGPEEPRAAGPSPSAAERPSGYGRGRKGGESCLARGLPPALRRYLPNVLTKQQHPPPSRD